MPMNLSTNDLWATMKAVYDKGGGIFFGRVGSTATGTGTSATAISTTYPTPNGAAEILAIAPFITPTASAAADSVFAMVSLEGISYKKQPQQVLAPIGSVNLSVGSVRTTPQEWYTVRAPVGSNDAYTWNVTPLIANSHNMKAGVDIMYATIPSGKATIYSQVSSVTTFKTAGTTSTGNLTLTAANEMYEVASGISPETANTAQETMLVSTTLQCSGLDPIQSFTYGQDPAAVISATSGDSQENQINRYMPLGLRFKVASPLLQYTTTIDTTNSNNLTTAHMVRYTSF